MIQHHRSTLFPYTTLFRSDITIDLRDLTREYETQPRVSSTAFYPPVTNAQPQTAASSPHSQNVSSGSQPQSFATDPQRDRKSTRLNSSHPSISYAVFCLKK